jgi:hypothetical protein
MADTGIAALLNHLSENPQAATTLRSDSSLFDHYGISQEHRDRLLSGDPSQIKSVVDDAVKEEGFLDIHTGPIVMVIIVA